MLQRFRKGRIAPLNCLSKVLHSRELSKRKKVFYITVMAAVRPLWLLTWTPSPAAGLDSSWSVFTSGGLFFLPCKRGLPRLYSQWWSLFLDPQILETPLELLGMGPLDHVPDIFCIPSTIYLQNPLGQDAHTSCFSSICLTPTWAGLCALATISFIIGSSNTIWPCGSIK